MNIVPYIDVSSFSMDSAEAWSDDIYDLDILVERAQALLDADQRPTTPDDPRTDPRPGSVPVTSQPPDQDAGVIRTYG